jgi:hypothetical protein
MKNQKNNYLILDLLIVDILFYSQISLKIKINLLALLIIIFFKLIRTNFIFKNLYNSIKKNDFNVIFIFFLRIFFLVFTLRVFFNYSRIFHSDNKIN